MNKYKNKIAAAVIVLTFAFSAPLSLAQGGFPTGSGTGGAGNASGAGAGAAGGGGNAFTNPIGVSSVQELLQAIGNYLNTIAATIAIIFIVIGGIMYMMSAGDEKMITRAKACIGGAIIGFAVVLAAKAFLSDITAILNGGGGTNSGGLFGIATRVLQFLLSIFGTIAIIALVVSGIMYLTAAGDDKRIETAKKMMTYSIIGVVVAMSALIIITQVAQLIGG